MDKVNDRAVRLEPLETEDLIDVLYGCLKDLPRDPDGSMARQRRG